MKLDGKVAIVTGGDRGIGKAVTAAFAEEGARVVIANPNQQKAEETVSELTGKGFEVWNVKTDVSKEADVVNAVRKTLDRYGRLDILVNSAGVVTRGPIIEFAVKDLDYVFDVNVKGTFLMCREAAKVMIEQGEGGRIINLSSISGKVGVENQFIYCASKAAVESFTKVLAGELGSHQISVNAVAPGITVTEMTADLRENPKTASWVLKHTPLGRFSTPEDMVGIFVLLASEGGSYINGEVIYVDGGRGSTFLMNRD